MAGIFKYYPLTILVTGSILFLSLFNPADTGLEEVLIGDKLAHSIMYAGLTTVEWFEYLMNHRRMRILDAVIFMGVFPLLLGGALELVQEHYTAVRSGEWGDLLADFIGVLTGTVIGLTVIRTVVRRLSSPRNSTGS